MFKVSFKDKPKDPSKAVIKKGNTTTVILKGVVSLPSFFYDMPQIILQWVSDQTKVELYDNMANNTLIIYSTGEARCHDEDVFDPILGERLAEARAKYYIYKFFYDLTSKLSDYYIGLLFGDAGVAGSGKGSCLTQDMKKYESLCIRESHHIGELLKANENG